MEYCGGGSLQDIYHGKITALKCFCFILDRDPAQAKRVKMLCSDGPPVGAADRVCQQRDLAGNFSLESFTNEETLALICVSD